MTSDERTEPDYSLQIKLLQKSLEQLQRQSSYVYEKQLKQQDEQRSTLFTIQGHIQDIRQQIDQLEEGLQAAREQNIQTEKTNQAFLLTEFNEVCNFWRHTDKRVDSTIRLYLTTSTVIVSSSLVLFQYQTGNTAIIPSSLLISFSSLAMSISGFFLSTRIIGASVNKSEYAYSINLIRRFFAEKRPEICPYLYMPIAREQIGARITSSRKVGEAMHKPSPLLIGIANLFSSTCLGVSLISFAYFYRPNMTLATGLMIVSSVACTLFVSVGLWQRRILKKGLERIGERHQRNSLA